MLVLKTTTADQTFKIIPREFVTDVTVCLRDDSTNDEVCVLTTGSLWNTNSLQWQLASQEWEDAAGLEIENNYLAVTMNLNLVEGRFYDLKITGSVSGKVVYRDKIFCTDQSIDQLANSYYDINSGNYVILDTNNNDYVIFNN
jgi:hypothetical protein